MVVDVDEKLVGVVQKVSFHLLVKKKEYLVKDQLIVYVKKQQDGVEKKVCIVIDHIQMKVLHDHDLNTPSYQLLETDLESFQILQHRLEYPYYAFDHI